MEILNTIIDHAQHCYSALFNENGQRLHNTAVFIQIDGKAEYITLEKKNGEYLLHIGDLHLDFIRGRCYFDNSYETICITKSDFIEMCSKINSFEQFDRLKILEIRGSLLLNLEVDSVESEER